MKSFSKVLRLSDCAETLEEARGVIDRQEAQYRQALDTLRALQSTLREYLVLSSTDGRPERKELRAKLRALSNPL